MVKCKAVIIIGSENDRKIVENSGMFDVLDNASIPWELSVISAHRNPMELRSYLAQFEAIPEYRNASVVYICIAGMSAALPGIVASEMRDCPVIGVALPSGEFSNAMDAVLSMIQMPSDVPVIFAGIGKSGCKKAGIIACQIVGQSIEAVRAALVEYQEKTAKKPKFRELSTD